jgi:hypothetical protein
MAVITEWLPSVGLRARLRCSGKSEEATPYFNGHVEVLNGITLLVQHRVNLVLIISLTTYIYMGLGWCSG